MLCWLWVAIRKGRLWGGCEWGGEGRGGGERGRGGERGERKREGEIERHKGRQSARCQPDCLYPCVNACVIRRGLTTEFLLADGFWCGEIV